MSITFDFLCLDSYILNWCLNRISLKAFCKYSLFYNAISWMVFSNNFYLFKIFPLFHEKNFIKKNEIEMRFKKNCDVVSNSLFFCCCRDKQKNQNKKGGWRPSSESPVMLMKETLKWEMIMLRADFQNMNISTLNHIFHRHNQAYHQAHS